MKYNFDQEILRKNTDCVKWEFYHDEEDRLVRWEDSDRCFGKDRLLPLWVADMDFPSPQPVIDALVSRANHGIFGYTSRTEAYEQAVINWMKRRHGWEIQPDWICNTPGVVSALNMLVRTFVAPGEKVIIQPPVYHPFFKAIQNNGAEIASNALLYENGRYTMDFKDLEKKAQDPAVKMAILCHPHNPVGRVWTKEELIQFGDICIENDVLVVSDEIHGDLLYKGIKLTPFATISERFALNTVVCTAASKSFNLAGLKTSNIIIPNESIRTPFEETLLSSGIYGMNPFGVTATEAAYNEGEPWLEEVMVYIEENYRYLKAYVDEHIPKIKVVPPEGTYLVWLDCRELGLDTSALKQLLLDRAGVYLDDGPIFGPEGEGFQRINIACPRSILAEALERIKNAVDGPQDSIPDNLQPVRA